MSEAKPTIISPPPLHGVYRVNIINPDGTARKKLVLSTSTNTVAVADPGDDGTDKKDKWIAYPVNASVTGVVAFRIRNLDADYVLSWDESGPQVTPSNDSYTTWNVEAVEDQSKIYIRVSTDDKPGSYVQADDDGGKLSPTLPAYSGLKFEEAGVPVPQELSWSGVKVSNAEGFQDKLFHTTLQEASWEKYDYIIVGSGIGGGVLANDLYDTNFRLGNKGKRVLLLEKGGLVFHSHCLNTARPAGLMNDRGQQNDTFFKNFRRNYKFKSGPGDEYPELPADTTKEKQNAWNGGPMYSLGGRSAAWGLFSPRVYDDVLEKKFGTQVAADLLREYYDKAERLMLLSLPTTHRVHQHVMDRLNSRGRKIDSSGTVQWQWGRIASEFKDEKNFDFAEGAYSSIDKLLEFAMSRPKVTAANKEEFLIEHKYFKTVINADVASLEFDNNSNKLVTGVKVRARGSPDADPTTIKLRENGKVILCAGSVDSPAILLRSGLQLSTDPRTHNALHLTDHSVLFFQCSFRYSDPSKRSEYGAMKLQTWIKLPQTDDITLVNMSIDASSFLPRGHAPDEDLPKFIFVFMLQKGLVKENSIELDSDEVPCVTLKSRAKLSEPSVTAMRRFTLASMTALAESAGLEFVGFEDLERKQAEEWDAEVEKIRLGLLPLGGVAHELGTLPIKGGNTGYCLNDDLYLREDICKGVYVCDLSCFPHSPEANPTLTLAALAIRLSRQLLPRKTVRTNGIPKDHVHVVNHSGSKVKAFLSYHQPGNENPVAAEKAVPLEPGQEHSWTREIKSPQALLVYKLDRSVSKEKYLDTPVMLEARPGELTVIKAGL